MRTMKQLHVAVAAVLKGDSSTAVEVQAIVLENMRHAQEHGDVSPAQALLQGLSGKRQLQKYLFAHFPLCWKKDKKTGNLTLGLREKREATDWQHDAAALVLWTNFEKAPKTEVVKGVKEFRAQLKRVVDGEQWNADAKKLAEKCLELVEEKTAAAKPQLPPELRDMLAAFLTT